MGKFKIHEIVPEAKTARPQLNYDIANESGTIISNKYKALGNNIIMRLIEISEDEIIGKS